MLKGHNKLIRSKLKFNPGLLRSQKQREVVLSLAAIISLVAIGVFGYATIEGWSLFDSLYMTVITLTTVGYMEVRVMSDAGRLFTIFLIVGGVGVVTAVLSTLARHLIQHQILNIFERKSMHDLIAKLEGHTIFCGYSRLSQIAVEQMVTASKSLVVVDIDPAKVQAARDAGLLCLQGDASDDDVLTAAGIARAKEVVTLLPKDSDNLYVILTARELNPNLFILSRAEDQIGEKRIRRAGADRIVFPYRVGGKRIADCLLRPFVTRFLDVAAHQDVGSELLIEEIVIPAYSPVAGLSIKDSQIRQKTDIMIVAMIAADGNMKVAPSGEIMIESGSTLIGIGARESFRDLEKILLGSEAGNE